MLRKTLFLSALFALAISPLLPSVRADDGAWQNSIARASWDYDLYRVERLAILSDEQGPFGLGQTVYFSSPADSCKGALCDKIDVTILSDAKYMTLRDVDDRFRQKSWRVAQDDRFVVRQPAQTSKAWFAVREYDPITKIVTTLHEPIKSADEISVMTIATDHDRLYTSLLHRDAKSSSVTSKLSVHDFVTDYERRDFSFTLTAPWQEILDVYNDLVLARFHFEDGSKQLVLIDERSRAVTSVPQSWGLQHETLVAAHFRADGTVQFFKNYRMFTYTPGDERAVEPGGAQLNWFIDSNDAYQVANKRMAWLSPDNVLYVSDVDGVSNYGTVVNREFALTNNTVYLRGLNGYKGFDFETRAWSDHIFLVTDEYDNVLVGVDFNGDVWYENTTTGRVLNIGFGSDPLLTNRDLAVFRGRDNEVYQVTFSPLLDLEPKAIQAFKSFDEPTVYLVSGNKIWEVPDEQTFLTWFDSFDQVQGVTRATMTAYKDLYENVGTANFSPGTRVKSRARPEVYLVGQDGRLHWVVSETVADSIWGSKWNEGIIEVRAEALWRYQIGTRVNVKNDVKTI